MNDTLCGREDCSHICRREHEFQGPHGFKKRYYQINNNNNGVEVDFQKKDGEKVQFTKEKEYMYFVLVVNLDSLFSHIKDFECFSLTTISNK